MSQSYGGYGGYGDGGGLSGGAINSGSAYDWNAMFNPRSVAQASPWAGGVSNQAMGSVFNQGASPYNGYGGGSDPGNFSLPPGMRMAPMPSVGGYGGGDGAWRPEQPMAGDIGFSRQPSYPNLGYNSSFSSLFAQQPANAYAALYGAMQFPNSGTPSQYYTGDRFGGGQYGMTGMLPPGFATPYSADNQGGALPAASNNGNWGQPWGSP